MSNQILALDADFQCRYYPADVLGASEIPIVISAAVGPESPPRCRNLPDDVRAIQAALNRFAPNQGGPPAPLLLTGIVDQPTRAAIRHFQEKWDLKPKGWSVPDGIVDRVGLTIDRLGQGPGRVRDLPEEFLRRIPMAMAAIASARRVLLSARLHLAPVASVSPIDLSGFARLAYGTFDRHFHVSTIRDQLNRLDAVDGIFLSMESAIGHIPLGTVMALEEPPQEASGFFMVQEGSPGGYHRRGTPTVPGRERADRIYLCPKAAALDETSFAYAIVHELAHYVGPQGTDGIVDVAYFYKDPNRYGALTAAEAFRNADSYSQFAFEANGLRDFTPRW
ncbi:MAG: hypothetical protein MUE60_16415 [Candidatus Eisenbacteria bacterium]|nr:hypothetical protein [Candidatus Eisenbacteria bacterium]